MPAPGWLTVARVSSFKLLHIWIIIHPLLDRIKFPLTLREWLRGRPHATAAVLVPPCSIQNAKHMARLLRFLDEVACLVRLIDEAVNDPVQVSVQRPCFGRWKNQRGRIIANRNRSL